MPRGKAIWNANGGFVSVLLTHLFIYLFINLFTNKNKKTYWVLKIWTIKQIRRTVLATLTHWLTRFDWSAGGRSIATTNDLDLRADSRPAVMPVSSSECWSHVFPGDLVGASNLLQKALGLDYQWEDWLTSARPVKLVCWSVDAIRDQTVYADACLSW